MEVSQKSCRGRGFRRPEGRSGTYVASRTTWKDETDSDSDYPRSNYVTSMSTPSMASSIHGVSSIYEPSSCVSTFSGYTTDLDEEKHVEPMKKKRAEPERKKRAESEKKKEVEPEKKKRAEPERKKRAESEKKNEVEPERKKRAEPEKKKEVEPEKKKWAEPENKKEVKPEKTKEAEPEKQKRAEPEEKKNTEPEQNPKADKMTKAFNQLSVNPFRKIRKGNERIYKMQAQSESNENPPQSVYLNDDETASSESDQETTPPKNFAGRLVEGEKWMKCPYFKDHRFISTKDVMHLSNCRYEYELMRNVEGLPMDIGICCYTTTHHVHVRKLKKHEMMCGAQLTMYGYLEAFIERNKRSKMVKIKKKEDNNVKDGNVGKSETPKPSEKKEATGERNGLARGRGRGKRD